MYANATEALDGLRHKRTGELQDTKIVANNTKLVYYADELIGLQLHETVIALFRADGVTFDTRGPRSPHGQGWFTQVTVERMERFSPARFFRDRGMLYVVSNPDYSSGDWTKPARLYTHGCSLSCDGSFENGLEPFAERAIASVHANWQRKSKNFAKRLVTYWRGGGLKLDCCDDDTDAHLIGHMEANEPCIPWFFCNVLDGWHQEGIVGEQLAEKLTESAYTYLRTREETAIHNIEPNFPYPQNPRV